MKLIIFFLELRSVNLVVFLGDESEPYIVSSRQ